MPEMRRFVVTQIREVYVQANFATDAVRIAAAAFEHGQDREGAIAYGKGPEDIWGNTVGPIREVGLQTKEVRIGG